MAIKKELILADPNIVHQPDVQFAAWCRERFDINRGVYNTIDEWLFQSGLQEIVTRRTAIISFLTYVHQTNVGYLKGDQLKFGRGKLIAALTRFFNRTG